METLPSKASKEMENIQREIPLKNILSNIRYLVNPSGCQANMTLIFNMTNSQWSKAKKKPHLEPITKAPYLTTSKTSSGAGMLY